MMTNGKRCVFVLACVVGLGACTVAKTAVGVTGAVVKTGVGVAGKTAGAVVDVVTPDGDDDEEQEREEGAEE